MVDINSDYRLNFPATTRNREPIAKVLSKYISANGLYLEIASGSGEHAIFMQMILSKIMELRFMEIMVCYI